MLEEDMDFSEETADSAGLNLSSMPPGIHWVAVQSWGIKKQDGRTWRRC